MLRVGLQRLEAEKRGKPKKLDFGGSLGGENKGERKK